jgi:hypothetical protein
MKAAVIVALFALSYGGVRHARLKELRQKVAVADQSASRSPGADSAKAAGRPSDDIHSGSQAASSTFSRDLVDRLRVEFAIRSRLQPRAPGSNSVAIERALIRELSMLDQRGARKLIDELQSGADPAETDGVRDYCLTLFGFANPPEALALLENLLSLVNRGDRAADAFERWALHRPGEAIHWFQKIEEEGSPLAVEPLLVREMIRIQCRIDPAKAMTRIRGANGEAISRLGEIVAKDLRNGREHQQFFSALQTAEERFPDSSAIRGLRSSYVERLTASLHLWPFEEAVILVNGFQPAEREKLVKSVGGARMLADPERWADWVVRADLPPDRRHPLVTLVRNWSEKDPGASGDWLDKLPAGALRDEASFSYGQTVKEVDPESAAIRAMTIGDEPRRRTLLKNAMILWRAADPDAAAAFSKERGIGD